MRQEKPGSGLVGVKETLQFEKEVDGGHGALPYMLQSKILPEFGSASASAHFGGWVCVTVAFHNFDQQEVSSRSGTTLRQRHDRPAEK